MELFLLLDSWVSKSVPLACNWHILWGKSATRNHGIEGIPVCIDEIFSLDRSNSRTTTTPRWKWSNQLYTHLKCLRKPPQVNGTNHKIDSLSASTKGNSSTNERMFKLSNQGQSFIPRFVCRPRLFWSIREEQAGKEKSQEIWIPLSVYSWSKKSSIPASCSRNRNMADYRCSVTLPSYIKI